MIAKIQYISEQDRKNVIDSNPNKVLIEEQNILEGNFLIFSDVRPNEFILRDIKDNTDIIILKQEGIL
ncbi:MAG TPA: hypothetical protein GX523_13370 [Desulfitobacterium dehalogenans]|uniref:Uncharacterized protein n=1 Tax=Desulfitobacterium dehalogenans TaxID=36854 RepID=A0A7C6Z5J1_9FIRM|nr:hypothetical protein [Desulfitobacterium dehalogenans]